MKSAILTAVSAIALASQVSAGGLSDAVATTTSTSGPDWSGLYVGATVGGGSYAGTAHDLGGDALDADGQMVRLDTFGIEAGLVAGYNVQRGNLVYGAEAEVSATSFDTDQQYDDDYRQDASTSSLLSLKTRVGVAIEDTLIYGTVGYGMAAVGACISDDEDSCVPDDDEIIEFDDMLGGLILGGGIEHRLTDALSVRLDYMHFESAWSEEINYDSGEADDNARFSADSSTVRIGVNYHF